jgi:hypothetical protein
VQEQTESNYEKTTNMDSLSEYSQLTNSLAILTGDASMTPINTHQIITGRLQSDLTDLSPNIKEMVTTALKNDIPFVNTYSNLFGSSINQRRSRDYHGVIIGAHRGGMKNVEPENTIRAFEKAIEIGVQVIELDVSYLFKSHSF